MDIQLFMGKMDGGRRVFFTVKRRNVCFCDNLRYNWRQAAESRLSIQTLGTMFETPPTLGVSIIISTLNRVHSLGKTLGSLRNLDIPPHLDYEILVVDNGSTDKTRIAQNELIKNYPGECRYFVQPKKGKSNALNLVVPQARGEILVFTDDDVVVDRNWIRALWDALNTNGEALAVQGKILLQEEVGELPSG
jgi:cellulose synthase/poly-beta-1,6-N-acetylglucosamine synthase-like glycosyltransferase